MEIPHPANIGKEVALGAAAIGVVAALFSGIPALGERMHNDAISSWSSAMRERLDPDNLPAGAKYYPAVRVVGSGRTLAESLNTRVVNVREFPGFTVPVMPGLNLESRVVGTLNIGDLVPSVVVLSNGWGVTECDNIWKQTWEAVSGGLCAVHADYLLVQRETPAPIFIPAANPNSKQEAAK